jgi:putative tricarboxylic transport membrane protein
MAAAKREERIASFVVALFSIAYILGAFSIPNPALKQQVGPSVFPKVVGFLMLLLSLIYMAEQFLGLGKGKKTDEKRAEIIGAEAEVEQKADLRNMGLIILIMILYALLFETLGYAITTFLAFMGGVLVLDRKHLVRDVVIGLIASFGLQIIFGSLLNVNLPAGPLSLLGF